MFIHCLISRCLGYGYQRSNIVYWFWFGANISIPCEQLLCDEMDNQVSDVCGIEPIVHLILLQFVSWQGAILYSISWWSIWCLETPRILELEIAWQAEGTNLKSDCVSSVGLASMGSRFRDGLYIGCLLRSTPEISPCGRMKARGVTLWGNHSQVLSPSLLVL